MTVPGTDAATILPLMRWLGVEAELLSPQGLRAQLTEDLDAVRRVYGAAAWHPGLDPAGPAGK